MTTCPKCPQPVLRVIHQPSTTIYVHQERKGVPAATYGCAVSNVKREARG